MDPRQHDADAFQQRIEKAREDQARLRFLLSHAWVYSIDGEYIVGLRYPGPSDPNAGAMLEREIDSAMKNERLIAKEKAEKAEARRG